MLKAWLIALSLTISIVCAFAQDHTIYEIQYPTDSTSNNSPFVGQTVSTGGFVTAVGYLGSSFNYYFISDRSGGLWHGILVNDNQNRNLAVGDSVHLEAEVQESNGQTRLRNVVSGVRTADTLRIAPAIVTCRQLTEPVEGVLVQLQNVIVTAVNGQEFTVTDGDTTAVIGNGWPHMLPVIGDTLVSIRGVVSSAANVFKVNPRSDFDLSFTSNRPPVISEVHNNPVAPSTLLEDTVTARITDETLVADARVYYRFGSTGDFTPVSMFDDGLHGDGGAADRVWGAILPAGPARATCYYYVWAADDSGKYATNPPNAPQGTLNYVISPTMADIYANYPSFENVSVTLVGIVNFVEPYITSGGSSRITVYMQDESGRGMQLSGSGGAAEYPNLRRGNRVSIQGTISSYSGAVQMGITSSSPGNLLASNQPMPAPIKLKTGDRRLQRQVVATPIPGLYATGTFCEFTGTIYRVDQNVGGGANIAMDDGTGSTTIRLWDSMNIDSVCLDNTDSCHTWYRIGELAGKRITVRGPSSTYNGDFQMLGGGDVGDFLWPQTGAVAAEGLVLSIGDTTTHQNRPFAPDLGQTLRIAYSAPAMGQVRIRIFDLRGRLVTTLVDKQAGGPDVIEWDGRNEQHELLPLGTYILHLESISNGNSETKIKPIVIGTKL